MAEPKLIVALEARLNKFEKDLKAAGAIADRQVASIEDRFANSNPKLGFIGGLLKGAVAAFSLQQAIQGVLNAVSSTAKLGDVADRIGISAEALQELRYAVQQTGGELDTANGAMERFAVTVSKAQAGQGLLKKLFEQNGQALSNDMGRNLLIVAELIKNAKSEQDQLNIATIAFGRGAAPQMVGALKNGAAALIQLGQEGRNAGAVLKNSVVKSAQELDDAWDKLTLKISQGAKGGILAGIDGIDKFMSKVGEWARSVLPYLEFIDKLDFKGALALVNSINPISIVADKLTNAITGGPSPIAEGPAALGPKPGVPTINISKPSGGTKVPTGGGSKTDQFAADIAGIEKRTAALIAETAAIDLGTAAQARAKIVAELEAEAKKANTAAGLKNTEVTDKQRESINRVADAYALAAQKAAEAKNPLAEFGREARNVTLQMQNAVVNGLTGFENALIGIAQGTKTAEEAFHEMANAIIADLARIAIRAAITGPIAAALGMPGVGFLGAARAAGGPVSGGTPYLVGEKGPEMFMPKVSGNIIPNNVLARGAGGAAPIVVSNTYHFDAGIGPADMALIRAQIQQSEARTRSDVTNIVRGSLKRDSDALKR